MTPKRTNPRTQKQAHTPAALELDGRPVVYLKPGREKNLLQGHPWIFSGAIDHVEGEAAPGAAVVVGTALGEPLAVGAYSPASQIRVRLWSMDPEQVIDRPFLRERLRASIDRRRPLFAAGETAVRLVHGESDLLPGLVVDQYADVVVLQALSAGVDAHKADIADLLGELTGAATVYERSDVDVRRLEGLPEQTGLLRGAEPPEWVEIVEDGLRYRVDVRAGHKTGFYLDQRVNRRRLRAWAAGRRVLNCFSYSGAFSAAALAGGAQSVESVDTSADALALGAEHVRLNGLDESRAAWCAEDVFQALRLRRDRGESYDLIVLDPPKFAHSAGQVERACRGYKDINLLAFKLLRPGGVLFTFSCSGAVSADLFQKVVAGAAADANVPAQVLETLTQGPDHPTGLFFPEGAYLKGLVCRVM